MADKAIKQLVQYGIEKGLCREQDRVYVTNQILQLMGMSGIGECDGSGRETLEEILTQLLDSACAKNIIENTITARDLFDARLMNCLLPRPSQVIDEFEKNYRQSPEQATKYFYQLSQDSDYIRTYRVSKDEKWTVETKYGVLDITINLSKPEKDPKAIAAAKLERQSGYPKCLLCMENEGYGGTLTHPGRSNHRIIPICINQSQWGFQYSPYVYYQEHCIVFNCEHVPMQIERDTFVKLLDFVSLFPHYFIGSNADLPIVGGSILTHDHFQGGNYTFAMERAAAEQHFVWPVLPEVEMAIVYWPMSVVRLCGDRKEDVTAAAEHILNGWRAYSDPEAMVISHTGGQPHNTITPIARRRGGKYELDLVLRNNLTTAEYPDGLYHPHPHLHHIKKENIGLIEVMGLAVLPSRLKGELARLAGELVIKRDGSADQELKKHQNWAAQILRNYPQLNENNVMDIIRFEVGKVFGEVLENAGVFKCNPRGRRFFGRFLESLGFRKVTIK